MEALVSSDLQGPAAITLKLAAFVCVPLRSKNAKLSPALSMKLRSNVQIDTEQSSAPGSCPHRLQCCPILAILCNMQFAGSVLSAQQRLSLQLPSRNCRPANIWRRFHCIEYTCGNAIRLGDNSQFSLLPGNASPTTF